MKKHCLLPILLVFSMAGCFRNSSNEEHVSQKDWIQNSVTEVSTFNAGWSLVGGGGGGSSDGAAYQYELILKGKSLSQVSSELKSLIKDQLVKNGFTVNGGGSGGNDFSIRAYSPYVRGTIMVSFAKPSAEGIPVVIAIAQVERH